MATRITKIKKNKADKYPGFSIPKSIQTNPVTIKWALNQTVTARNLLYNPNAEAKAAMATVAKALHELTDKYLRDIETLRDYRVINGGLLHGLMKQGLVDSLGRTAASTGTGNDHAALISYLGDLGTIIVDYRSNKTNPKNAKFVPVNEDIDNFLKTKTLKAINGPDMITFKAQRGGIHFAPAKGDERRGDATDLRSRKGIFESGIQADKALNVVEANQIKNATWPDQYILTTRLQNTTVTEPWAGHMSGSCPEVVLAWDIFTNVDPMLSVDPAKIQANAGKLDTPVRRVKVAFAAAMLIGLGFHSAMEVYEPTDDYLGMDHRAAIIAKGGVDMPILHGVAPESTTYIDKIIESFTMKKKLYLRRRRQHR